MLRKVEQHLASPNPLVHAKRLADAPHLVFRYRVGDYRVVFDWEGNGILITTVGHRREVYR